MNQKQKTVYVVATPLGHVGDLTQRARDVLATVDVICAEDTRTCQKLMQLCGIQSKAQLKSYHQHNERAVCDWLEKGDWETLALVSDAGTPNIHDPGHHLLSHAWAHGWRLVPVPGPCALTAALSVCDAPTHPFLFVGFLPAKRQDRKNRLESLSSEQALLCFYESPHRMQGFLEDLKDTMGHRRLWLARELTKKFEQIVRTDTHEVLNLWRSGEIVSRGEFVVLVSGSENVEQNQWYDAAKDLTRHLSHQDVIAFIQRHYGARKNEIYRFLESLKEQD